MFKFALLIGLGRQKVNKLTVL